MDGLPRAEERDGCQEAGQHDEPQTDPIDPHGVTDAEDRNPGMAFDELKVS